MSTVVYAYAIAVGCLVFAMWAGSLAAHKVPELQTAPWEIRLHLSAEFVMAVTLVAGGVASLAGLGAGSFVVLLGLGMTLYSIVNSAGYFIQRREVPPTVMFGVLLVLTVIVTVVHVAALAG